MNEKISFQQITELLSELTGSSLSTSELFIKELFATVSNTLSKGETVTIKNIGTFSPSGLPDHPILYAPDKDLAEAINMPFACFEAVELNENITDEALNECINDNEDNTNGSEYCEIIRQSIENPHTEETETISNTVNNDNTENDKKGVDIITKEQEPVHEINSEEISYSIKAETNNDIVEDNYEYEEEIIHHKTRNWLYVLIGLIIGIVIGYTIGNYYPCRCVSEGTTDNAIIIKAESDTLMPDSIISIITETDNTPIGTDTIRNNRFLTTMARQYYGEMNFWVYIYEENKEFLANPNRIKPGTVVIIPNPQKYGIDKNDSISIEKAKLKAIEIYAPYQK